MTDAVPSPARPLRRTIALLAAVGATAVLTLSSPIIRAAPFGDAPIARPTSRPTARPLRELGEVFAVARDDADKAQPEPRDFFDPARQAAAAARSLPPMRKLVSALDEMLTAVDTAPEIDPNARDDIRLDLGRMRVETLAIMSLLGDADGLKEVQTAAQSTSREERVNAQAWLYAVDWARTTKDPVAQEKVAAAFAKLAGTNIDNEMLAGAASIMAIKPASPALGERIEDVVINTLRSPRASKVAGTMQRARKMRAVEGQDLVIAGATHDGKDFSSAGWKGKVVIVQFWATTSATSMAELPRLKKVYRDNHGKGLEIVGVSCDREPDDFKQFLKNNPDLMWPQLLDPNAANANADHPLAAKFGIETIPSYFVVDKKGVCRTVHGEEKLEETVQKLLAE